LAIAARWGVPVVADAAAALGARYRGREVGEIAAAYSAISFNGNKTVTAGGGGAILSNDPARAQLARHLTTTAPVGADYLHDMIGFNYRLTNLQAAVGCAQLERLGEYVARKRAIRRAYNEGFADLPDISFFPEPDWAESACWFSGIVLDTFGEAEVRDI